eukprot:1157482-Pelagomonas_calceolata.AAC.1
MLAEQLSAQQQVSACSDWQATAMHGMPGSGSFAAGLAPGQYIHPNFCSFTEFFGVVGSPYDEQWYALLIVLQGTALAAVQGPCEEHKEVAQPYVVNWGWQAVPRVHFAQPDLAAPPLKSRIQKAVQAKEGKNM